MPKYRIRTYDVENGTFTPEVGLSVPHDNLTIDQLKQAIKELRQIGYTVHRRRGKDGDHFDNDPSILIERVDSNGEHLQTDAN